MSTDGESTVLDPEELDAAIFDLDGVLTDTAPLHFRAWKATLDDFLERRADEEGIPLEPLTRNDHARHLRGKPRYEGVRDFLRARGIELPFGDPSDPPDRETMCGLGNDKDRRYRRRLEQGDVEVFAGAVELVRKLKEAGVATGVATASRNGTAVLEGVAIDDLFDVVIDGAEVADDDSLTGKPAPDQFLETARRLGAEPGRSVVVEDSAPGVEAGRRGGFGVVVAVARGPRADALEAAGADLVVRDLSDVPVASGRGRQAIRDAPEAENGPTPGTPETEA